MLLRPCIASLVLLALFPAGLHAQNEALLARVGWDPLPDTLFIVWHLDDDQIHRLKVVEEDHDAARVKVMADPAISESQRETQLRKVASARKQDIKGVLTPDQYRDWQRRVKGKRSG